VQDHGCDPVSFGIAVRIEFFSKDIRVQLFVPVVCSTLFKNRPGGFEKDILAVDNRGAGVKNKVPGVG
jgi:hypothetical protein